MAFEDIQEFVEKTWSDFCDHYPEVDRLKDLTARLAFFFGQRAILENCQEEDEEGFDALKDALEIASDSTLEVIRWRKCHEHN